MPPKFVRLTIRCQLPVRSNGEDRELEGGDGGDGGDGLGGSEPLLGAGVAGSRVWVTVTVNVFCVASLPALSCAAQLTVVVPIGKIAPEDGWQSGFSGPSRSSLAEAV
jgi:hypothetical protein